ncbi:MAG: hypothetical protein GY842_28380, partial [bacterium]|nr:hypothetical protein [bacterium]
MRYREGLTRRRGAGDGRARTYTLIEVVAVGALITGLAVVLGPYAPAEPGQRTANALLDCNANSVPDDVDIAGGTSWDCNTNGVPDECEVQRAKLLADDGDVEDWFGFATSISGEVAVVGARYDDDHGSCSGSAYVFRYDGVAWEQEAKLAAADGAKDDYFGHSVSVSGDVAIVGAYQHDDPVEDSGAAYIFQRGGSTWERVAKLAPDVVVDEGRFGHSVSISGGVAVVGAPGDGYWGSESGAAYVFRRHGAVWELEARLAAEDGARRDEFGWCVSINGDIVIVGAHGDDDHGDYSGSAYVFRFHPGDPGAWEQEAKLTASDGYRYDYFGHCVSIGSGLAIVGAFQDDDNGSASGSAYLFRYHPGAPNLWAQEAKLTASDGAATDYFGRAVAIMRGTALVGAYRDDDHGDSSGSIYVFRHNHGSPGVWEQEKKITAVDAGEDDRFGRIISVSGHVAVVGAYHDDDSADNAGAAYVLQIVDDCNGNGAPDECDIAGGTSRDCQADRVADECQLSGNDCNSNGVPDECDIYGGTSTDCATNGIPDECKPDCNSNGVADECDTAGGTSADCSGDQIPDECDPDCNLNGVADSCDIFIGTSQDCNANSVPDECDLSGGTSADIDHNDIPDDCQSDCNDNGVPDHLDITAGTSLDCDSNGIPDACNVTLGGFATLSTTTQDYTSNGITIAKPPGTEQGDLLVAVVVRSGLVLVDAPPGWELFDRGGVHVGTDSFGMFYRVATASEPDAYTMTWQRTPDPNESAGAILRYTNVYPKDPINAVEYASKPGYYPVAAPSTSTSIDKTLILRVYGSYGSVLPPDPYPADHAGRFNIQSSASGYDVVRCGVADRIQESAGPTGAATFEVPYCESWRAVTVALRLDTPRDCNSTGTPDSCDIAQGTSPDCNSNDIPDDCEPDCNSNEVADSCDIAGNTSTDCNSNSIPDSCDVVGGTSADLDGYGVPDECQPDCNWNNVPDGLDISAGTSFDCHTNGVPDECEMLEASLDCDGELPGNRLLVSVSIDGPLAVVGAADHVYDGPPGAAHVYRYQPFGSPRWLLEATLTADDGLDGDRLGAAVSISGDVALIGAPYDDGDVNLGDAGAAYVFRYNAETESWEQEAKLTAADGAVGNHFGNTVSISGDVAIVGGPGAWNYFAEAAYVFRYNGLTWELEDKLTAYDGADRDAFGSAVSVSGNVAVIGARLDDDQGDESGSAYVFRYDGSTWEQEAKLTAVDGTANDSFGSALSVSGDVAIVGARHGDASGSYSGSAYIFRHTGATWVQESQLIADDGAPSNYFGSSVAIRGNLAVVGAIGDREYGSYYGSTYVFRYHPVPPGAWLQTAKVIGADVGWRRAFGYSVAISGTCMLVGVNESTDWKGGARGSTRSGEAAAYIFRIPDDCNENLVPD